MSLPTHKASVWPGQVPAGLSLLRAELTPDCVDTPPPRQPTGTSILGTSNFPPDSAPSTPPLLISLRGASDHLVFRCTRCRPGSLSFKPTVSPVAPSCPWLPGQCRRWAPPWSPASSLDALGSFIKIDQIMSLSLRSPSASWILPRAFGQ